jgi:hypothetical protein
MIKHETTQQAVKDIEKYYNALDKVGSFSLGPRKHFENHSPNTLFLSLIDSKGSHSFS